MRRLSFIAMLVMICLFMSSLWAEENNYRKADRDLQRVFEHFEGISLKSAINQLLAEKQSDTRYFDDVRIRLNRSDFHNHLYIGRENTIEFQVKNLNLISAASLGFKMTCSAQGGMGNFNWVANHGTITPSGSTINNILKVYPDAFDAGGAIWLVTSQVNGANLDTVLLGGISFPGFTGIGLPNHVVYTTLYSLRINVPNDPSLLNEEFCIDNILVPPAGEWLFTDSATGYTHPPDFQGVINYSTSDPSAPPVCFTFAEPQCQNYGKSSNPNVIGLDPEFIVSDEIPINYDDYIIIVKGGDKVVDVAIRFTGDERDLINLGAIVDQFRVKGGPIYVTIPLNKLPDLCQLEGVNYIRPQQRVSEELNYSAPDIDCDYAIIQDSMNLRTDQVIVGIIESGLDWLNEDFIDSNGNTRILYFGDQNIISDELSSLEIMI